MTESQTLPDLRPVLLRTAAVTDSLVEAVAPAQVHDVTPCDEYDVQALVDHLVLVVRRIRIVLDGGDFRDALVTGLSSYDDVHAAWREGLAELRDALPGFDLSRMVTAPFGTVPGGAALGMYVGELTVHSWDLARAIGRDDLLDQGLAEAMVGPARANLPAEREGIPFADVVEVADDAPAYDRLVGWYGRDPRWVA